VGGTASIASRHAGNELFFSDGYFNHRIAGSTPTRSASSALWGALAKPDGF